jgi:hypothetical protein
MKVEVQNPKYVISRSDLIVYINRLYSPIILASGVFNNAFKTNPIDVSD